MKKSYLKFKEPKVSFVMCTYNGASSIEKCMKFLFSQNYPKNKIEVIIADAGSIDGTLEIIKKYSKKYSGIIKLFHNAKQHVDGKGNGLDQAFEKADKKSEFIAQIFQDNLLIDPNWLRKMLFPMILDKEISATQTLLYVPKYDKLINKYLGAVGMEDPFAIPYALTSQVVFNPQKFEYHKKEDYYSIKLSKNNFLYGGNNGCIVRTKDFWKAGGYEKDTEEFYRFALNNYKVAVPANTRLYHITAEDFDHFLKKRWRYIILYFRDNYENRNFYWFDLKKNNSRQNFKFIKTVLFNIIFIPGLIEGIRMALKEKRIFWLSHPIFLFSITADYIFCFIYIMLKRLFGKKLEVDVTKQNIKSERKML